MLRRLKILKQKYQNDQGSYVQVYDDQGRNIGLKKVHLNPILKEIIKATELFNFSAVISLLSILILFCSSFIRVCLQLKNLWKKPEIFGLKLGNVITDALEKGSDPIYLIKHYQPIKWPINDILPPISLEVRQCIGDVITSSDQLRELVPDEERREWIAKYYAKDFNFPLWSYNDWRY